MREPVEEERVEGQTRERARRAGVLVTVLVERRLTRRIERQFTGADLDEHVLRLELRSRGERRTGHLVRTALHAVMRKTRRRDALRARNEALRAGHLGKPQGIAHGLRLNETRVLEIAFDVETLPDEDGRNGTGQHEHVSVETQSDIGHGKSFRRLRMIPKPAVAWAREPRTRR